MGFVAPVAAVAAFPGDGREPGLGLRRLRELAGWYQDEGYRRHSGDNLDTAVLDAELRAILREEVFPEHVEVEFQRVMDVVFAV